ncbi:hypothetical protein FOZ62_010103, partial [Perkinsus olseni]
PTLPPPPRTLSAPSKHYDRFYEGYFGDEYYVGVGSVSNSSPSDDNFVARDGDAAEKNYADDDDDDLFDDNSSAFSSEGPGTGFEAVLGPIDQIQYKKEKLAKWDAVVIK